MKTLFNAPLLLIMAIIVGCQPSVDIEQLRAELEATTAANSDAIVAVSIRDPATGTELDINGDRLFHAASTMKVPVMIEVFRRAEAGTLSLDDSLQVVNRFRSIVDGSPFSIEDDSDDMIYESLGSHMSVRDLVFNMITVSSNLATNLLIDFLGAETVQATSERLGTTQMRTLRGVEDLKAFEQGLSNRTTASDLATLMLALQEGRAVSEDADQEMVDILAEQQFNEMIPAGLPDGARVAHKTGQISAIHHDAAVVYPRLGRPYVLIVLIEGIEDDTESAALGARVARVVHRTLR